MSSDTISKTNGRKGASPMCSETSIRLEDISKCYQIYDIPRNRLKQFVLPRLQKLFKRPHKQYFREFWALNNISFDVKKGETVGIIGKNGSGKSTLLQIICGTLSQTTGHVETSGRIAALLELGAGFNPEFSGRENIYLNGAILGLSRHEIDEKLDQILDFAGIGDFIDQPVKTYSSGMYVRLAFSIQANIDPDVLIIDEALAVGDAYFVHRCMHRFKELQKKGVTILFVSHDGSAVKNLCDRAIWIDEGQIKMSGTTSAVVDDYLSFIFKRTRVDNCSDQITDSDNTPGTETVENSRAESQGDTLLPEKIIHNSDRRLGDQDCSILGASLYDVDMNPISVTPNDANVVLRMTIVNHKLKQHTSLIAGYIFRNSKGIDIASTNSQMEDFNIISPGIDEYVTVRFTISLPVIYPGSYTLSPTVAYLQNNDIVLCDRVDNAVVFEVTSEHNLHVLLRFKTQISSEDQNENQQRQN